MTINLADNTPRVSYAVAEGVTQTSFTVSFEFFDDADLNVYVDGVLKTLTTDYTVTGGDGSTGSVSISVTGAAGGSTVVITRDIDLKRTTDFPASGAFQVGSLNTELDKLIAIAADLDDKASRALQLTDFDSAVSLVLPDVDTRKGKTLAFNASTGAVESGPSISDVQTVSAAAADIATLADIEDGTDATDAIQTVAGISSNVSTVAGISSNVTTVAGISSDVTAVAGDATDIGTVAGSIANVNTVAGIDSNVTTVAGISSDVTAVAADATDIGAVAAKATEIGRLGTADAVSDLNTLGTADAVSDMNTLAAISTDITSVADISSDVTTAASNISDIQNASTNAATATTKAAEAATSASNAATSESNASTSESNAAASAAAAAASFDAFDDIYLGAKASAPTQDNDGDALTNGDLYFDTGDNELYIWNGSAWQAASPNIVADTTPQLGGDLDTNGNDINFGDNDKAVFGAGSDLQIYHDGSNSYVSDQGTGSVNILASDQIKLGNSANTEVYAKFNKDGNVELRHDNAVKLETTSTGIDVTGTVTADDLTVDTDTLAVDATNDFVGINTTTQAGWTDADDLVITNASGNHAGMTILNTNTSNNSVIAFADGTTGDAAYRGAIEYLHGDDAMRLRTGATERLRIDSSGNVGIGTTSPGYKLDVDSTNSAVRINSTTSKATLIISSDDAQNAVIEFGDESDNDRGAITYDNPNNAMAFTTNTSEKMRIDSSGNVGIGVVPSGTAKLQVNGQIYTSSDGTASAPAFAVNDGDTGMFRVANNTLGFTTGGTERLRIDSSGSVMFQTTDHDAGVSSSSGSPQFSFRAVDGLRASTNGTHYFNKFVDGVMISFRGQGTDEGNITINGTTISYNGGHLSRWSQATDGNRIDGLVKGTVMTNLDQMAVWTKDGVTEDNEQLNCMAVSSVEGDANVAGVFVNWDDEDLDYTADMNVAMTGDMVIRIASGTTVARGDLLMSAGDGTAKSQGDDIVRSKTIAKVTSTNVSHTYDDGSYLVPCVLMAC